MRPFLCLCSATLSTSGATIGKGGVVISMWFLVGIERRDGIWALTPTWPLPTRPWFTGEVTEGSDWKRYQTIHKMDKNLLYQDYLLSFNKDIIFWHIKLKSRPTLFWSPWSPSGMLSIWFRCLSHPLWSLTWLHLRMNGCTNINISSDTNKQIYIFHVMPVKLTANIKILHYFV